MNLRVDEDCVTCRSRLQIWFVEQTIMIMMMKMMIRKRKHIGICCERQSISIRRSTSRRQTKWQRASLAWMSSLTNRLIRMNDSQHLLNTSRKSTVGIGSPECSSWVCAAEKPDSPRSTPGQVHTSRISSIRFLLLVNLELFFAISRMQWRFQTCWWIVSHVSPVDSRLSLRLFHTGWTSKISEYGEREWREMTTVVSLVSNKFR